MQRRRLTTTTQRPTRQDARETKPC
jgi:hypothetical protein